MTAEKRTAARRVARAATLMTWPLKDLQRHVAKINAAAHPAVKADRPQRWRCKVDIVCLLDHLEHWMD